MPISQNVESGVPYHLNLVNHLRPTAHVPAPDAELLSEWVRLSPYNDFPCPRNLYLVSLLSKDILSNCYPTNTVRCQPIPGCCKDGTVIVKKEPCGANRHELSASP